jgi:hypothetical protein
VNLPKNIKIKKWPWIVLPILGTYTAHAIYPNIYIPKHLHNNLISKNPKPKYVAILIHEQTHIERQKKMGWFIWELKYCFSNKFRFKEELEAIKAGMKYMKTKNEKIDTTKIAKFLSSYLYLWCTNFKKAKKELDKAWQEA